MAQESQSLKNHVRLHPVYHFFFAPVAILIFIYTIVELVRDPSLNSAVRVVGGIWMVVGAFLIRIYPLKVQDRVIRLEERMRLRELLAPQLQSRIGELSEGQLVALRFASDQEVGALMQKAADGKWNQKQIKEAIQNWRADLWRV